MFFMNNKEIADILNSIADILELQGVDFKPRAYRKAAQAILVLSEDINQLRDKLQEIPGVGEHIAKKILELLETGKLKYYEDLRNELPKGLVEILNIPHLGPKKVNILYQKLKIKNIDELEKAI